MIDLLGKIVDEDKYFEELKTIQSRETIKSAFRKMHGFKSGSYCKNCAHFIEGHYHNRNYFKCQKMGLSHSEATDIRKSDVACSLYEESEGTE